MINLIQFIVQKYEPIEIISLIMALEVHVMATFVF